MRKGFPKIISVVLSIAMALSLTACGGGQTATETTAAQSAQTQAQVQTATEKIVNVGVTNTLESLNPLLLNGGEINKYATGLMFLPLMELDKDLNFQPMLADSITTEDNRNFIVHIDEKATWSDGTPVTAADVEYTVLRLASPVIANYAMMYYVFEGVGDDGFVEEGATSIDGVKVIDEKTIQFTTKDTMSLNTFQNSYARYLLTLPKHKIEQYSEAELSTAEWFTKPDVVSGPYIVTDYDVDHYISYTANTEYWKGVPKVEKLNIRIVDGSQIYAGLQSGEIDITQHTMTDIPMQDYESIEALENVDIVYGSPVTNQSMFIQTANIPDARVRQAMLYAIDREKILNELMKGHGEVIDGFLSSASPYFDETITPVKYDPEKAKALLAEAGWDGSKVLQFYVNSGDSTFVNAATIMVAQWQAVGIKAEVKTVDFATLMSVSGSRDYDILAVQYTYAPVDPYADMNWLLSGEGSWTGYSHESVSEALAATQTTMDTEELTKLYSIVNRKTQEDVPMISAYVISALGAKNKRLTGAEPSVYGFFNEVHNWDVTQ
ncbi:MAG: ABC transporter substrate-binding protein [Lachnoclostridium sp.]|nr:ABC transporter substrate-binding protein [Lachnoclostridium sp.]